jgi:hypothetical protein
MILLSKGYKVVDIWRDRDIDRFWLHVEKEEIHSPASLHERNQLLYEFARSHALDSYDGMEVGAIPEK